MKMRREPGSSGDLDASVPEPVPVTTSPPFPRSRLDRGQSTLASAPWLNRFRAVRVDSPAAHGARYLALRVSLRDRLSLVVLLLPSAQPELDLRVVAREVHAQRDQRVSLLAHLADEARDLFAMQQQLARSKGLVVHEVGLGIWRDVHVL